MITSYKKWCYTIILIRTQIIREKVSEHFIFNRYIKLSTVELNLNEVTIIIINGTFCFFKTVIFVTEKNVDVILWTTIKIIMHKDSF